MQRALWYTGLAAGGTTAFVSLAVVGSILLNGTIAGVGPQPEPSASQPMDHLPDQPAAAPVEANPEAPEYVLRDPAAPPRAEGDVHEVELVMSEREMTVAPGIVQTVWSFGDAVPGPCCGSRSATRSA